MGGKRKTTPSTSLGSHEAGIRPEKIITVMTKPEQCMCAWDMHGEQGEDGKYTGLYWFTLKFRHQECPAKMKGLHK